MRYPIYFEDYRRCIHCGASTVVPIDQYGNEDKVSIYPITHMICNTCHREYCIQWIDKGNKKIPVCCSEDDKQDFISEFIKGE